MTGPSDVWQFLVSFAGFAAVAYQLRVEPRRKRRQAAIDAWRETLDLRHKLQNSLPDAEDDEAIKKFVDRIVKNRRNKDAKNSDIENEENDLRLYLNYWEALATGALSGVLDIKVLVAVSGGPLKRLRNNYQAYIDDVRVEHVHSFEQMTFLVDEIIIPQRLTGARIRLKLTRKSPRSTTLINQESKDK